MIYLIESGEFHKIGFTQNEETLNKRLQAYRTHNPLINLIGVISGDRKVEKELHNKYKSFNIKSSDGSREWFNFKKNPEVIVKLIKDFQTPLLNRLIFEWTGLNSYLEDFTGIDGEIHESVDIITDKSILTFLIGYAKGEEDGEQGVYVVEQTPFMKNRIYRIVTNEVKSFWYDYDEYGDFYSGFILGKSIFYNFRKRFNGSNSGISTIDNEIFLKKLETNMKTIKLK